MVEKKNLDKSRFVWDKKDLNVIGKRELTDEEKSLVEKMNDNLKTDDSDMLKIQADFTSDHYKEMIALSRTKEEKEFFKKKLEEKEQEFKELKL